MVAARGAVPGRDLTNLADLLATPEHPGLDAAHDAIAPDTIAKFLLTSGSTGNPKAVINTHRMLCANQVMIRETLAFLKEAPPVIVDWLPWNHTFGGNHNIGLTLFNGGSMYLDEGKPTPDGIGETVRNLREVSPTVYFNVPKGYESLLPYLRDDSHLRAKFFASLQAMFFSGAAMSPYVWNSLDAFSVQETGFRVPILTGSARPRARRSSCRCGPTPAVPAMSASRFRAVMPSWCPNNGKLEVRAKGPNVTPGYWRQPELTAAAFDDEGFYKFGDAIKPAVPDDFDAGFDFDGRIAEDFKLASGTWVSVGPLRARFIADLRADGARCRDRGHQPRRGVGAGGARSRRCRQINPALSPGEITAAATDPRSATPSVTRFAGFLAIASGSSARITRAICSIRRCRSIVARSPTRARSTSARCWTIAPV